MTDKILNLRVSGRSKFSTTGRWPAAHQSVTSTAANYKQVVSEARSVINAARINLDVKRLHQEKNRSEGKILLVEDDSLVAVTTSRMLSKEGFYVSIASNGNEACSRFNELWEAVVVDINLGSGCSGLAVATEARRRTSARVILWSDELDGEEMRVACRAIGAHTYVKKGTDTWVLLNAIRPTELECTLSGNAKA